MKEGWRGRGAELEYLNLGHVGRVRRDMFNGKKKSVFPNFAADGVCFIVFIHG